MKSLALFSLTHKENAEDFARSLISLNFDILSTGGTANYLQSKSVPITPIEALTEFPEILNGRVKTLHPKIHAGILADWSNKEHQETCSRHNIQPIRCLYINLYDFEKTVQTLDSSIKEAIESIDVGGPSMIRGAAKNFKNCLIVTSPEQFEDAKRALEAGYTSEMFFNTSLQFAQKAFALCSAYDATIERYLSKEIQERAITREDMDLQKLFHSSLTCLDEVKKLKYGENPHQSALILRNKKESSPLQQIYGPELSYNNILDLEAGILLCKDLEELSSVIIKHNNPCGVAIEKRSDSKNFSAQKTLSMARTCDPLSAFGGIAVTNGTVDKETAQSISDLFLECMVAHAYTEDALDILRKKSKLRIFHYPFNKSTTVGFSHQNFTARKLTSGWLLQNEDLIQNEDHPNSWELVVPHSEQHQTPSKQDLYAAWISAKHVKSNAILLWNQQRVLGIGPGQTSRIESAEIAFNKASKNFGKEPIQGAILASDAFLPFSDTVELASRYQISTIVQPGGSIRDAESIAACKAHGIAMYFTKIRHFRH